jgi:DNA polymerase III sliding clamp (beta) subunit (PCNA family)
LLISRKIDANFPAYERVIPKGNDKQIEFDRDRLSVGALRRVRLLSNERSKAVKFRDWDRPGRDHITTPLNSAKHTK